MRANSSHLSAVTSSSPFAPCLAAATAAVAAVESVDEFNPSIASIEYAPPAGGLRLTPLGDVTLPNDDDDDDDDDGDDVSLLSVVFIMTQSL